MGRRLRRVFYGGTASALALAMWLFQSCGFHRLAGTVVDESGGGISECDVVWSSGIEFLGLQERAKTDAGGGFLFAHAPSSADCSLRFEKIGYFPERMACPKGDEPMKVLLRQAPKR